MKVIDIAFEGPSLQTLLALAQHEDVVLARQGRILARVQKFSVEDLTDARFEHDPKVIRQGEAARRRFQRGEGKVLSDVRAELGIARRRKKRRLGNA